MTDARKPLAGAVLAAGLFLLAHQWTTLVGRPIGTSYREVAGFALSQQLTLIAMALGALGVLWGAAALAFPLALRSGAWLQKMRQVLPAWLLCLAVVGIVLKVAKIGTVGDVLEGLPIDGLTFASAWLGISTILATLGVLAAILQGSPDPVSVRKAAKRFGFAAIPIAIACLGMLATLFLVSTNLPAQPQLGGAGAPAGGAAAQTAGNGQAGSSAGAPAGGAAASAGSDGAPGPAGSSGALSGTNGASGASGSQTVSGTSGTGGTNGAGGTSAAGTAAAAGGPGGGPAAAVGKFKVAGGALVVLGLWMVAATMRTRRALKGASQGPSAALAGGGASAGQTAGGSEATLTLLAGLAVTLVAFALAQLAPISITNPPAPSPVVWDSALTDDLAARACMDCHSNETKWPWYSRVAPASWLVTSHVHAGREGINLSALDEVPAARRARLAGQLARRVENGSMPPADYLLLHPEARLTDEEKKQLMDGFKASLGTGQ